MTTEPQPISPNGHKPIDQQLMMPDGRIAPLTAVPSLNGQPMNPHEAMKMAQLGIRYNTSPAEQKWCQDRANNGWDHARPNSVLVAAIGNHWRERSWARVMDMVHYANNQGYYSALVEIQDRCMNPYDALGTMRNEAIIKAMQGWEYLCMVDTDVLPQPETLVRLIVQMQQGGNSIIAPYVDEPGTNKPLHGPVKEKFKGTSPVRWCVLSFLVFRTQVFNCTGPEFWDNAIGSDEGYHFQKLYHFGHTPMLDSDIIVPTQAAPTYPLTTKRLSKEDHDRFWASKEEWRQGVPDRRPVAPGDPRVKDGMYLPFFKPPCPVCKKDMTEIPLPDGVTYKCMTCVVPAPPVATPATPVEAKPVAT